jgi:1-acyl-sn-glycerol-3-phosphate acyltransferase
MSIDLRYRLWMHSLKVLGTALLHTGYRLRIEGAHNVPEDGGVLVVSNHVSFHDWLFLGVAMPRPPRFVMHQHHHQYPLLRAFFDASRVIPIAPKKEDGAQLARALDAIDEALENGELVVLFPEGTMTPNGELSPFRPGLERILKRRSVPVVPVGITGLFGSWFSRAHGAPMTGRPKRFRAKVTLTIGAPLTWTADELASRRSLRDVSSTLRGAIEKLLGRSSPPEAATLAHAA